MVDPPHNNLQKTVLGQDNALSLLHAYLEEEGHKTGPYLFLGKDGVGKTTTARAFAKDLGALDTDILEYSPEDTLWKVGILRDAITASKVPPLGPVRVLILRNIHRVPGSTKQRFFDALLKVLEDGHERTVFILTADRTQNSIPDTLRERLTPITFTTLTPGVLGSLLRDSPNETVTEALREIGPQGLNQVLNLAGGSLADATALLCTEIGVPLLCERASKLLKLLPVTPSGQIILYLNALPDSDLEAFYLIWKTQCADLLTTMWLSETADVNDDGKLLHPQLRDLYVQALPSYRGDLSKLLRIFSELDRRLRWPTVKLRPQLKASILAFKLEATIPSGKAHYAIGSHPND